MVEGGNTSDKYESPTETAKRLGRLEKACRRGYPDPTNRRKASGQVDVPAAMALSLTVQLCLGGGGGGVGLTLAQV
jgi:hypothetical protein